MHTPCWAVGGGLKMVVLTTAYFLEELAPPGVVFFRKLLMTLSLSSLS